MIKAIIFDFSRVLLNAKDPNYPDSLNSLYKRVSQNKNFNSLEYFEFNKELLDFVISIKDKYDLYIFTTGTIQNDIHLKSFIDHVFKKVFTVDEVGFSKNSKEAYEFIAKEISFKPEEILFIDDTTENIQAAGEAGLKTIKFEKTEQVESDIKALGK